MFSDFSGLLLLLLLLLLLTYLGCSSLLSHRIVVLGHYARHDDKTISAVTTDTVCSVDSYRRIHSHMASLHPFKASVCPQHI